MADSRVKPPLGRSVNWAHPFAKGLVGCWLFNEGAGNTINDTAGRAVLTPAAAAPTWGKNAGGPLYTFSGAQSATFGVNPLNLTTDMTVVIDVWGVTSTACYLVGNANTSVGTQGWVIGLGVGGKPAGVPCWFSSGAGGFVPAVTSVADGAAHRIASRLLGTTVTMFVDGKSEGSGASGAPVSSSITGTLGASTPGPGAFLTGSISRLLVFKGAKTDAEIKADYAEPFAMFRPRGARTYFVPTAATGRLLNLRRRRVA